MFLLTLLPIHREQCKSQGLREAKCTRQVAAFSKVKMCKHKLKRSELFLFERKQGEYATEAYKVTLNSEGQKRDLIANKGPKASQLYIYYLVYI